MAEQSSMDQEVFEEELKFAAGHLFGGEWRAFLVPVVSDCLAAW
jgi:hypothetical protein